MSDNEGVLTVTEPQVWVLIGVFAAAMFGMIGIVTTSLNRNLGLVEAGIRSEISGLRETMNAKFDVVDAKFDGMDAKLTGKFDALDRDIATLTRHVFGTESH